MKIDDRLVPVFEEIDFANRYVTLCRTHNDFANRMSKYDQRPIERALSENGIPFAYLKGENFFLINEPAGEFEVHFKIVPSNGFLQFLFSVLLGEERLQVAMGMWEVISRTLIGEVVKKPIFTTAAELVVILKESILIYKDFKTKLQAI